MTYQIFTPNQNITSIIIGNRILEYGLHTHLILCGVANHIPHENM